MFNLFKKKSKVTYEDKLRKYYYHNLTKIPSHMTGFEKKFVLSVVGIIALVFFVLPFFVSRFISFLIAAIFFLLIGLFWEKIYDPSVYKDEERDALLKEIVEDWYKEKYGV